MVSNLTTILQNYLTNIWPERCQRILLAVFKNKKSSQSVKFVNVTCDLKCLHFIGGFLGWVKSGDVELSQWLQAILFCARGGFRSGEEHQGVTSSPALSLHPPRAC